MNRFKDYEAFMVDVAEGTKDIYVCNGTGLFCVERYEKPQILLRQVVMFDYGLNLRDDDLGDVSVRYDSIALVHYSTFHQPGDRFVYNHAFIMVDVPSFSDNYKYDDHMLPILILPAIEELKFDNYCIATPY